MATLRTMLSWVLVLPLASWCGYFLGQEYSRIQEREQEAPSSTTKITSIPCCNDHVENMREQTTTIEKRRKRKDDLLSSPSSSFTDAERNTTSATVSSAFLESLAANLLHPALLAHPQPKWILIMTMAPTSLLSLESNHNSNNTASGNPSRNPYPIVDAYLQIAMQHKGVSKIDVIAIVPSTTDDEAKEKDNDDDDAAVEDEKVKRQPTVRTVDSNCVTVTIHEMTLRQLDRLVEDLEDGTYPEPFNPDILYIDATITSNISAPKVTHWYEVLHPIHCWDSAETEIDTDRENERQSVASSSTPVVDNLGSNEYCHTMTIWELQGTSHDPSTSEFRYALSEALTNVGETSVMTDFDVWVHHYHANENAGAQQKGSHRNYILAVRYDSTLALWHRTEAEWMRIIHQQIYDDHHHHHRNADHEILEEPMQLMDSNWMIRLEYPSKYSELEFCRRHPTKQFCPTGGSGFDDSQSNVRLDQLRVQKSLQGAHAGRGVFTTIPLLSVGMYVGAENQYFVRADWMSMFLITQFAEWNEAERRKINYTEITRNERTTSKYGNGHFSLYSYLHGYGFSVGRHGREDIDVDSSLMAFVNHGCVGSFNVNQHSVYHESNFKYPPADLVAKASTNSLSPAEESLLWSMIPSDYRDLTGGEAGLYFPIRHDIVNSASKIVAPIEAGHELLDNYMPYGGMTGSLFWPYVDSLRMECEGVAGTIEIYQESTSTMIPSAEQEFPQTWNANAIAAMNGDEL